jgi:large subunit ribosomal protein L4
MPEVPAFEFSGAKAAPVAFPDAWFAERPSEAAIWQAVRASQANRRQGTASTLTRSVVAGSKAKPWKQKGTGRARAGTRTSPIFTGGGIVFGPHPRDHRQRVPKQLRRLALRSALRQKLDEGAILALRLETFEKPQTSRLARALSAITDAPRVLLLTAAHDENLWLSGRNEARLTMKQAKDVNAEDVLRASVVVVEAGARLPALEERTDEEPNGGNGGVDAGRAPAGSRASGAGASREEA